MKKKDIGSKLPIKREKSAYVNILEEFKTSRLQKLREYLRMNIDAFDVSDYFVRFGKLSLHREKRLSLVF